MMDQMSDRMYVRLDPAATRLGNWMFQYAAAKCASPAAAVSFVIPDGQDMEQVRKYQLLWTEADYVRVAPSDVKVRTGYFQDTKWVNREMSRQLYLGPLAENFKQGSAGIPQDLEAWFSGFGCRSSASELVSIHVRRGDYLRLPHRHPFVGVKYLREAVARFPESEFLVFSDDLPWCRGFFKGPRFHFAEGNTVLADLYLMTQCRGGHICSNSTFSWWGAYLGEGKTVFPSMWYGPAHKNHDWDGMYFEGSEVLNNSYTLGLYIKARVCMFKTAVGNCLRRHGLK